MLMQIAQKVQLELKRSTPKHELKRLIVEQVADKDLSPVTCIEVYKPLPMEPSGRFVIRRFEIERELKLKEFVAQQQKKSLKLKLNNEKKSLKLNSAQKSWKPKLNSVKKR